MGAAGQFAGLVIPEIVRRGAVVGALIHHPSKEAAVRALGATEVVVGNLLDRASLDASLAAVDGVFYIAPAFLPRDAEVGVGVVEASRAAQPALSGLSFRR